MKSRLILADDHPMVRQGLRELVALTQDMEVVAEASNGNDAERLCRTVAADLLVLDIHMPQRNGIAVLKSLRADGITLPVLFFTMTEAAQYAAFVRREGAQGFAGKEAESQELLQAMRLIVDGGTSFPVEDARGQREGLGALADSVLSKRENQVMQGLLRGDSLVSISAALGISDASASTYRRRILDKLGVSSNAELIWKNKSQNS